MNYYFCFFYLKTQSQNKQIRNETTDTAPLTFAGDDVSVCRILLSVETVFVGTGTTTRMSCEEEGGRRATTNCSE